MRITIKQENLSKALQNISRIASHRTPLPILNNILLKTDKNRLFIAATNLEIATTEYIGAKVDKDGSITVPARLMTDFIQNLPSGNISIEVKGKILHISTNHYNSTINGLEVDEFPELPIIKEKDAKHIVISPSDLKRVISQSIVSSSSDTARPMLTGVFFHTYNKKLYTVATDGYRLSECILGDSKEDINAIIPASSLQEVIRLISDDIDDITLLIDDNQARFRIGEVEITSKLIDATYVDYRQLIPKSPEIKILINKSELLRITKISNLFARESAGGIKITADLENGIISVNSIASQLGENTSEASAEISGSSGSITINAKYLIDILNIVESEKVEFSFSGKLSPCLVRSSDKNSNFQAVIMPLKS